MSEKVLVELASIVVLGIAAQWLAWRFRFPSILFFLVFGFIAGPVIGFLNPDELMGDLLIPVVSISVALILFEGGLTLRLGELRDVGKVVITLIIIGAVITWIVASAAAHYILNLNLQLSILLGAILTVTGPTVIGPLLSHIRPLKRVGTILKWEGILIDPVGAILAVLVFEAILAGEISEAAPVILLGIVKTIFIGGVIGYGMAKLLILLLRKFLIPDILQESVALVMVIGAFVVSNILQPESGLLTVTLMGLFMDNQKLVSIKHIVEFKENLRVIIISSIFILLAARLQLSDFQNFDIYTFAFLGVLIFIARPLSVFLSTIGSKLNFKERTFISWMAPRGIVAAAVSAVFALKLAESGIEGSEILVPITFLVIVVTVIVYGTTSLPLAKALKVVQSKPQGIMFVGAHSWARLIAKILKEKNINVIMVDTNRQNIQAARLEGLPAYLGSILSEHISDELDLDGIGRLMALTPNDEANSLASLHMADAFERGEMYQLPPLSEKTGKELEFSPKHLRARFLFGEGINYFHLNSLFTEGWTIKSTKLSDNFTFENMKEYYSNNILPLFRISNGNRILISTIESPIKPESGDTVIALVLVKEKNE
ncbi:MAG: cation:proton antiporter [Ignavibacteria bacterium]|nr:cation:proton antiporter [Ignavibacteria bacterium]MBT8382164.1 cation:proton antiporter [Ignavibacteria bacterium]MBT8392272.1 cation:proton antiporter [Ignavibacteria bacterium]NNJ53618.1 sodium:proton antiporter [Ignavibacteriaceae bacterium]NNL20393.1 sodium:proton antiporter [Ignavibacteriaceae bacterium]